MSSHHARAPSCSRIDQGEVLEAGLAVLLRVDLAGAAELALGQLGQQFRPRRAFGQRQAEFGGEPRDQRLVEEGGKLLLRRAADVGQGDCAGIAEQRPAMDAVGQAARPPAASARRKSAGNWKAQA